MGHELWGDPSDYWTEENKEKEFKKQYKIQQILKSLSMMSKIIIISVLLYYSIKLL